MNKDNLQFALILGLFAYIIFLQQCKTGTTTEDLQTKRDTIIQIDTMQAPPIMVQMPRQEVPAPTIIYIDSSKNVVLAPNVDTAKHSQVHIYQDSLEDENLTLYYHSMVKGQLLHHALDYKLKIPKQITKTIQISKPYPQPVSSLMLTAGVGGNVHQFASLRLGLQFVSKKGWSLGYDYDLMQKVHSLNLGLRLVPFKPKR